MPTEKRRTIVVCIGNELIADDAVGFEVYQRLSGVAARLEYLGVCGIDLLELLEGETDMIVVDAVELGAPAGTVHVLPWERVPATGAEITAHMLGLKETMEIGRILYPERVPERVTLVGVEGRCFNRTREFMTPKVEAALEEAVWCVQKLVHGGTV